MTCVLADAFGLADGDGYSPSRHDPPLPPLRGARLPLHSHAVTIFVVRHASAGRRTSGPGDLARSLDEVGWRQAEAIADVLAHREIELISSSPAIRCLETVAPLAERIGVEVEPADELMEGRPASSMLSMVRRLAGAGVTAVLCSHGDVIPTAVSSLAASGILVAGNRCDKGSIWTLRTDGNNITEARYSATDITD